MKVRFNAIPLWLMKAYLTELGATETTENVLVATGWQAEVRPGEPYRIGSLVVGATEVTLAGDAAAIEAMLQKLQWKTMRGGG